MGLSEIGYIVFFGRPKQFFIFRKFQNIDDFVAEND